MKSNNPMKKMPIIESWSFPGLRRSIGGNSLIPFFFKKKRSMASDMGLNFEV